MKAIELRNNTYHCNRCGTTDATLFSKTPCLICGECVYCRNCLWLGKKTSCDSLEPTTITNSNVVVNYHMDYSLSPLQQKGSEFLVSHVNMGIPILIWAVCGAGKTELVFEVIKRALNEQKQVCFTVPRVDVVREIVIRLRTHFDITIYAHYGKSEEMNKFSPFMVMTTHQLLKYYNTFDLIILDEVDAFPYSTDLSLHYGLQNALKKNGNIIYLSATPSKELLRTVKQKKMLLYTIPSRYHRKPLDLPQMVCFGTIRNNKKLFEFVHSVDQPLLIFVPTIDLLIQYSTYFQIECVHAKDQNRALKIEQFKKGKITKLMTTTILERGITLKNLCVIVLHSEHRLFNEASLVQIAGRVGRKKESPTGNIYFIYEHYSIEMFRAYFHIRRMNRIAKAGGLIE